MAEWLEQESHWHKMYCHGLEVTCSNPSMVELGVCSTFVESCTWTQNYELKGFLQSVSHRTQQCDDNGFNVTVHWTLKVTISSFNLPPNGIQHWFTHGFHLRQDCLKKDLNIAHKMQFCSSSKFHGKNLAEWISTLNIIKIEVRHW